MPETKDELLKQSRDNYKKLIDLIDSFSEEQKLAEFPHGTMNRNIRDVLAHLHHWHLMFLDWYTTGMSGKKPDMPAKGYTWKETKELNKKIWQDYRNHNFKNIRTSLEKSHAEVHSIINKHIEQELFEKKKYFWTATSSLATYLRANTSSHYMWAYNLIRQALKKK